MKIIVPFCPTSELEIDEVELSLFEGADIIEWRADYFTPDGISLVAEKIFKKFAQWPILFTLRTSQEGGNFELSESVYISILRHILIDFHPEFVDVEAYSKPFMMEELADFKDKLVYSYHNFQNIPDNLEKILTSFAGQNPSVIKLALTARSKSEVWDVLMRASLFREKYTIPLIIVIMGEIGKISRLVDSPWTFARLEPVKNELGQYTVTETKKILELL
ncbi:type I 3-dehydroquinate dehydratase [Lactovum miscens]|uniref:3-dehydroquinate dehydratase n=1 Tax=Lactovum miscens TaxID=190387 RepID=A0A841C5P0_9LACT|nr:type I 3-dehydroquinate dehydratase [Lactovum miscens]MBB5888123.1 3-dehydroquinate dehydratase-1 [Lactovum miscens]